VLSATSYLSGQTGCTPLNSSHSLEPRPEWLEIGITPEHMARMRARRRPFSDPRAGRLLSAIEVAFLLSRGEPISTTGLVRACYPFEHIFGENGGPPD